MFTKTGFKDFIIVAVCVFVFAASVTVTAGKDRRHNEASHSPAGGPAIAKMAQALDVPADRLRSAFEKVGPPSDTPLRPPSEQQLAEHSLKLAVLLNVPADRLRSVLAAYAPPRL